MEWVVLVTLFGWAQDEPVERLIEQLGHDQVAMRLEAEVKLRKVGRAALKELREAAKGHSDPEIRARAEALVKQLTTVNWRTDMGEALKEATRSNKHLIVFSTVGPLDGYV